MRDYHIKHKYLRPDLERKEFKRSVWAAVQIIAGLLALLAIYGWMGARDAEAAAIARENNISARFAQYLTHGYTENADTIFMCERKAYEVQK